MGEVGQAVTRQGLDRQAANALVNQLIRKYEHIFNQPAGNPGVPFTQAYDLDTLEPRMEWLALYEEVKEELHTLGLTALS